MDPAREPSAFNLNLNLNLNNNLNDDVVVVVFVGQDDHFGRQNDRPSSN